MGLLAEFDIIDDFGYTDCTDICGIYPDYSEGTQVFVKTFMSVSRDLVPVDTGYLRSTLYASGDDTYCIAKTDCEYAQYVEYGTWKQTAQPYFEPALEAALRAAAPLWDEAENYAWEEEEEILAAKQRSKRGKIGGGMPSLKTLFTSPLLAFGLFVGLLLGGFLLAGLGKIAEAMSPVESKERIHGSVYMPEVIIY